MYVPCFAGLLHSPRDHLHSLQAAFPAVFSSVCEKGERKKGKGAAVGQHWDHRCRDQWACEGQVWRRSQAFSWGRAGLGPMDGCDDAQAGLEWAGWMIRQCPYLTLDWTVDWTVDWIVIEQYVDWTVCDWTSCDWNGDWAVFDDSLSHWWMESKYPTDQPMNASYRWGLITTCHTRPVVTRVPDETTWDFLLFQSTERHNQAFIHVPITLIQRWLI